MIQHLENTIEQILKSWNVPGAAVGIIKDGEIISGRGYGVKDLSNPSPVDIETNFAIGSNTKAFTTACLGKLVEEGKLAWDDKVIKYLPDFAVYDPWVTKELSVRDILSHKLGVADVERFLYNSDCPVTEVIRRLRYVQPAVPFRSNFVYSNISFMVAGEILRVITGQSWETLVQDWIFKPLGMNRSTTNFIDVQSMDNITMPHVNRQNGLLSMRTRMIDPAYSIPWYDFGSQAAGGITSNVSDMLKWLSCFLGNGSYQGKTILNPETVAEMTRPTNIIQNPTGSMASLAVMKPDINFWTYGLGWFIFDYHGYKVVLHGGQVQGMISTCAFLPQENLGFVVLTNINLSLAPILTSLSIMDAFTGGNKRNWSSEALLTLDALRKGEEAQIQQLSSSRKNLPASLSLSDFAGIYTHNYFGEHTVSMKNDDLMIHFAPHNDGRLEHWDEDTFYIHWLNDPFEGDFISFTKDARGQVTGFTIKNEGFFTKI